MLCMLRPTNRPTNQRTSLFSFPEVESILRCVWWPILFLSFLIQLGDGSYSCQKAPELKTKTDFGSSQPWYDRGRRPAILLGV